jgi:hypothetical protein
MQGIAEHMLGMNKEFGIDSLMLESRVYGKNDHIPIFQEKEDIYKAMKPGANHSIGPIAVANMISFDVCLAIMETLKRDLTSEPIFYVR